MRFLKYLFIFMRLNFREFYLKNANFSYQLLYYNFLLIIIHIEIISHNILSLSNENFK